MENITNEIMEVEEIELLEGEVIDSDNTDISTGVAVLIGAAATAAVVGAVKLGKKVYAKIKAKREAAKDEAEIVEVSDDEKEE